MDAIEAVISCKLEALRQELAEKEKVQRAYEEAWEREWERRTGAPVLAPRRASATPSNDEGSRYQLDDEVSTLQTQVTLLNEIKKALGHKQHSENRAYFLATKARDERSSKQNVWFNNVWFNIALSAISLIAGLVLGSLVGSSATVLHMLGH